VGGEGKGIKSGNCLMLTGGEKRMGADSDQNRKTCPKAVVPDNEKKPKDD